MTPYKTERCERTFKGKLCFGLTRTCGTMASSILSNQFSEKVSLKYSSQHTFVQLHNHPHYKLSYRQTTYFAMNVDA